MCAVKSNSSSSNVIILVAIITALSLLGDSMLYIVLPVYWKEAGLDSIWQVGILLAVNRFIRLPFNPFIGWLYQKISLRTGLILAVILGSVTTLGYGMAKGFVVWIILRGVWGIAWSFFRIGGLSAVVYYSNDSTRGKAMGLYNGLYRTGSLFGMLLGGVLVPIVGLQVVSILFGCLSFIGLPLVFYSLRVKSNQQTEAVQKVNNHVSVHKILKHKIIIISTGFLITMLIQGVLTSTVSAILQHSYGEKITLFGLIISVTFFSGLLQAVRWAWEPFLGSLFGHWSDGPSGRIPLYIFSLIISSFAFGMIASDIPLLIWIVIMLIVMIGATSITTLTDALASDIAKTSNIISFLTVYSIAQDIGAALGPFISYMLIEVENGFGYLYWGGSVIFGILAIGWTKVYLEKNQIFSQSM
ncbi:MFS transporter [Priestia aryabhattai]|uniref:MFS transporter n=1 Tax=Priestia aryabhattai TaxID=412384 RepID=UPI001C8D347D|nr:MFS transporter [Priestia aryabhattai]MBY0213858.1 MFS transporter [Priestia aryabhattai]